jgi:putative heme-binding domain-containing protein
MNRTLLLLLVAATAGAQDPGETRNPRTSAADIEAGAATFRSHCSACHGMKAEGGRGPNLANGVFFHGSSDADLLANISNGIPGTEMPGLFYSPDRVWQIVAYIRSVNAGSAKSAAGDTAAGAEVFRASGCGNCHRIAGSGGRLGPDLTQIGQTRSPDHLRTSILDPNADVRSRYRVVSCKSKAGKSYEGFLMNEDTYDVQFIGMDQQLHTLAKADLTQYKVEAISKMPSYRGKLSPAQLQNLVAYLSSLRPAGGVQ